MTVNDSLEYSDYFDDCHWFEDYENRISKVNVFKSLQYGLQFRLLYKIFMGESDLLFLPTNGINGGMNITFTPMIGIRAPFIVMPYLVAGPAFTYGFNIDKFKDSYLVNPSTLIHTVKAWLSSFLCDCRN